jgi:hypothetical protein
LDTNHEVRMGQIRQRVVRAGTRYLSPVGSDRRYLLEEVDRLARALAEVERRANGEIESQLHYLSEELRGEKAARKSAERDRNQAAARAGEMEERYDSLAASVAELVNSSTENLALRGKMHLHAAMAHQVRRVEKACEAREETCREAERVAGELSALRLAEAEQEKEIRRRVHARFKRVRREAILASETIHDLRRDLESAHRRLKIEADLGLSARKFAALAYRALESEDLEDRGQEPMWP